MIVLALLIREACTGPEKLPRTPRRTDTRLACVSDLVLFPRTVSSDRCRASVRFARTIFQVNLVLEHIN